VCAEFNECQDNHESTPSIEMEDVWIASNSENKIKGRDANFGVVVSNSYGHRGELYKEGHVMKIIEILQKDAQARRADSRKLMRVRDRQGEFNLKMLKNLERIERKLEKESDISKTRSRKTPERKRRSRSGSRHRHLSPKHSDKEAHSGSIPSPTKKNRRSGVD
jgi:hypothetical protein